MLQVQCSQSSMPHSHAAARLLHRAYSPQGRPFGLFRATANSIVRAARTHTDSSRKALHIQVHTTTHSPRKARQRFLQQFTASWTLGLLLHTPSLPRPSALRAVSRIPGAHARNSTPANDNTTVSGSTPAPRQDDSRRGAHGHSETQTRLPLALAVISSTLWFWNDATRSGPTWRT
jgi:hypothetical protein